MIPKIANYFSKYKNIIQVLRRNFFDSIWTMLDFGAGILDGFLLNIILVRLLTVADYGDYKTVFSVINILIIFSITGLNNSVAKAAAKKYRAFFLRATRISVLASISASAVLVILAFTFYRDTNIKLGLLYSAAVVPVFFGLNTWISYLTGSKRFKQVFIFNLFVIITKIGLTFVFAYFTHNYIYCILAFIGTVSLYNLIYYLIIIKNIDKSEIRPEEEKELTKHGLRITGATVISVLAKNVEKIVLNAVSSSTQVGIYSIANIIPTFLKNGFKSLLNVPAVKLASRNEKDHRSILKRYMVIFFVVGVLTFVLFWFITPFLLKIFFDVTDPVIIMYSKLVLIPIIFVPFDFIIKYMAAFQGSGKSYFKISTATESVKLVSLLVLIPLYKINGIVIAIASSEFIAFIILLIWFLRSNKTFKVK